MDEPTAPRRRRHLAAVVPGLRQTAVLAVLCNLALETFRLLAVRDGYPWTFKTPTYPLMFLLGSLVVWLVVGLVHAITGRFWLTTALCVAATALVAVADYEKVRFRQEPLYPSDAAFVDDLGFLTEVVGTGTVLVMILAALVLAGVAVAVLRGLRRRCPAPVDEARPSGTWRTRLGHRALTGGACLLCLVYLAGFNAPGNAARTAYDALGASWRPWSQQRNYLGNGFVGGFLYNTDVPVPEPPPGYGEAEMTKIAARYREAAERINRTRDPGGLDGVNVVLVLSESFTDPTALEGLHVAEDPTPFVRRLMASTTSGQMLAQSVGGGTANMEFEALTGMSMSQFPPQVKTPYQMLVPEYARFPSAVEWFRRIGHRTLAIHPYTTEMYRRREVYRSFGFDEFVHDEQMHQQTRLGRHGYISDAAAFEEVRRRLVAEPRPLLVNLVTMQNHVPYEDRYEDPAEVTDAAGEPMPDVGQYVRGLTYTDQAVERFVTALNGLEERTVLVFYGDHLPSTYPEEVYEQNTWRLIHQTPFFVWANFGGRQPGAPPLTSPVHFMDLVLERTGAALPPYYALLHELRQEIAAMDSGRMFDRSGQPLVRGMLSERAARLLRDHRLVQYDLSVGNRYAEEAIFGDATASE